MPLPPRIVVFEGEDDYARFKKLDTFAPRVLTQAELERIPINSKQVCRAGKGAGRGGAATAAVPTIAGSRWARRITAEITLRAVPGPRAFVDSMSSKSALGQVARGAALSGKGSNNLGNEVTQVRSFQDNVPIFL
jgi:hypothetical protein